MSIDEEQHVQSVYSQIATHFSDTRVNQWPWITDFINETNKDKNRILDIGCGNGRNMNGYANDYVYGIDTCPEFVTICKDNGKHVEMADMCSIPFPDEYFDHLLCIAAFHHLGTNDRRIKALEEMKRIIKPGGTLLLSTWSIQQPINSKQQFTKFGDTLVKWNKFGTTYERYYYIFEDEELYKLFWQTGWKIKSHRWDHGNEIFIVTPIH